MFKIEVQNTNPKMKTESQKEKQKRKTAAHQKRQRQERAQAKRAETDHQSEAAIQISNFQVPAMVKSSSPFPEPLLVPKQIRRKKLLSFNNRITKSK